MSAQASSASAKSTSSKSGTWRFPKLGTHSAKMEQQLYEGARHQSGTIHFLATEPLPLGTLSLLHNVFDELQNKREEIDSMGHTRAFFYKHAEVSRWLERTRKLHDDTENASNRLHMEEKDREVRAKRAAAATMAVPVPEGSAECTLVSDHPIQVFPFATLNEEKRKEYFKEYAQKLQSAEQYHALCEIENIEDAAWQVDFIDSVIDIIANDKDYRQLYLRRSLNLIKKLCAKHALYPKSFILSVAEVKKTEMPVADGGYGIVWKGSYGNRAVAIKELKHGAMNGTTELDVAKVLCKEATVWKYLNHPNVTKFHGILVPNSNGPLGLVSTWMENGTLDAYLSDKPESNRLELIRNVIDGLCYLHELGLCHGDLKALNILVNKAGIASLADFGLASFSYNEKTRFIMETTVKSLSLRWAPPEIVDPSVIGKEEACPSTSADVYSFAWVMWEVFTGRYPFHAYRDVAVYIPIMNGARPDRPTKAEAIGLSKQVWDLMEQCWHINESSRPVIHEVQRHFDDILQQRKAKPLPSPSQWPLI